MNLTNTTNETETLFAQVEKMLYKLAWDHAKAHNLDFNECLSECHWAFVRALNGKYDPSRGTKFSTYVHFLARCRLMSLNMDKRRQVVYDELEEELCGYAPPETTEVHDIISELSSDAQTMAALLLEAPQELLGELADLSPKRLLSVVKTYLRDIGHTRASVNRTQQELKTALQLAWAA